MRTPATALVLGGYGFFGQRIAARLAADPPLRLLIGGRCRQRAAAAAQALGLPVDQAIALDASDPGLAGVLERHGVDLVVHAAGPFQGQDYAVARAAIAAGCDYVDLADGRAFVTGITTLDAAAREARVRIISGASSVPALSSAVVDRLAAHFDRLFDVRIGISSGARSPGLATVAGIFAYVGKPIERREGGAATRTHGWQDLIVHRFPAPVGRRLLGSCDVPDLDLLPARYPTLETATFHGGHGSVLGHLAVWALAGLVRAGILRRATPLAGLAHRIGDWLAPTVSDRGGMFVQVHGVAEGRLATRSWHLLTLAGHGPYVPCGGAIAMTRKLLRDDIAPGARPCVGMLSVDEYLAALAGLDVYEVAA